MMLKNNSITRATWCTIRNPKTIWFAIKNFLRNIKYTYQRIRYGISAADAIEFDEYLMRIMSNGFNYLREWGNTHPYRYTEEEWAEKLKWYADWCQRYAKLVYDGLENVDTNEFFDELKVDYKDLWD